jgi:hypothetical protein
MPKSETPVPTPSELMAPVGPDYWKHVPCRNSTEENPHEALVPKGFLPETAICYDCYMAAYAALKNKNA